MRIRDVAVGRNINLTTGEGGIGLTVDGAVLPGAELRGPGILNLAVAVVFDDLRGAREAKVLCTLRHRDSRATAKATPRTVNLGENDAFAIHVTRIQGAVPISGAYEVLVSVDAGNDNRAEATVPVSLKLAPSSAPN